ncbi:uncharacterized protein EV420DRAFT_1476779 [Desarmillaria tabescens]|uniref:Uncharacterized protein n=1 Tax=Armillaria tabescens TaxID=1929756 RepID=A0AA39TQI8_ARMTA|nr:uncharacterized protein EV420DRAFT_1476779 [Desarmillaria tabescens]KAK0463018.1 hypothetical protein EV420DRAFT_1476779 [Desarmillaria tabescens]
MALVLIATDTDGFGILKSPSALNNGAVKYSQLKNGASLCGKSVQNHWLMVEPEASSSRSIFASHHASRLSVLSRTQSRAVWNYLNIIRMAWKIIISGDQWRLVGAPYPFPNTFTAYALPPPSLIQQQENRGDVGTLRSCALVCRSWAPIAQSYLYETLRLIIKVSPPCRFSPVPRITRITPDVSSLRRIRSSQHLTAFIKTVSLDIHPSKTPWPGLSRSSRVHFHLSELFLTLTNVRHLIYVNAMPQTPFLKIISAPTIILTSRKLVSISVANAPFDDLFILLLHATNRPKLCLGNITLSGPRDGLRILHRLTFKSLAVYGDHMSLADVGSPLHSVLEFEKLTQLHIAFRKTTSFFEDSGAISTAETLIRRFKDTLETLTLNMYLYGTPHIGANWIQFWLRAATYGDW